MMWSLLQWASPHYFYLLLLLPFFYFYECRKNHFVKLPVSSSAIFKTQKKTTRERLEWFPVFLRVLGLTLLILALARPQLANKTTEVNNSGIDIMLALDTSGSMRALDMTWNGQRADRMSVVKAVVKSFVNGRQSDRVGMVVFGQQAYTQCPLTLDTDALKGYLDLIDVGIAGDATAIGNALATAVKRLAGSKAKSRVVILLTDGKSNAGEVSPQVAAELAKDKGIKVYTIAVGSRAALVPFPYQTPFGTQIRDAQLEVDEDTLRMIAAESGGEFFRADSTEALQEIYHHIDALEKTDVKVKRYTDYEELYWNLLPPALILLILAWVLKNTFFLRVP